MKLATTTEDFLRFCPSYTECLKEIREAGFRYVDFSLYDLKTHASLLYGNAWESTVDTLRRDAEQLGLTFVQAHSPNVNPLNEENADTIIEITERSIAICGKLGIPSIVVHAGWQGGIGKEEYFERNLAFYRRLYSAMEKHGVNVLVENSTKAIWLADFYYLISGADMLSFLEEASHPLLHACWDTGHANIEGGQYEHLMTLGKHLYALHVNDNRGERDEHIIPYLGTMNMDDLMHGLIDVGYRGYFTFEACSSLRPQSYWLGNRRTYADPRLAEPTLPMQRTMEALMYRIGEHVLSAYGCFEE